MSTSAELAVLRFAPLASRIEGSFWAELERAKLLNWRLDDSPRPIRGFLASCSAAVSSPLTLRAESLRDAGGDDARGATLGGSWEVPGTLLLTNTVEEFEALVARRDELMSEQARRLCALISGELPNPAALSPFFVLAHADIKKHVYKYWIAFPALQLATAAALAAVPAPRAAPVSLVAACAAWRAEQPEQPAWLLLDDEAGGARALPLAALPALLRSGGSPTALAFADPQAAEAHPGWPLRNLLVALAREAAVSIGGAEVPLAVLRVRGGPAGGVDPGRCQLLSLTLPLPAPGAPLLRAAPSGAPLAVGWERDGGGMLRPRSANMYAALDPGARAEEAVSLNSLLIRWRLAPELDTERLAAARFLLLGAGTLGCAVARSLLGYGARRLTLLDCGRVGFSNPTRQSLFSHADACACAPKATAAAAALRAIYPACEAQGVQLTIPSPGCVHASSGEEAWREALADSERLDGLVRDSDVVFLLTDTRESRWLPTLLAKRHGVLAVTSAIGFDTYLVMRHGSSGGDEDESCYFCADVCAPRDSTANRPLDMACTVSRPGVALVAAGIAAELAVASMHAGAGGALGGGAHIVRGSVRSFEQSPSRVTAFPHCAACAAPLLEAYGAGGERRERLLRTALSDPAALEAMGALHGLIGMTPA